MVDTLDDPSSRRLRVLAIDDDADAAWPLATLLQMRGHDVQIADNGPQALAAFDAFRPDVALMDLLMPDISGYELARLLRAAPGGARAILIATTGWSDCASAGDGFDGHLLKPIDLGQVEALMTRLAAQNR
jgi:two-component system, chemotaxis family, CheB/CheR fusion protein